MANLCCKSHAVAIDRETMRRSRNAQRIYPTRDEMVMACRLQLSICKRERRGKRCLYRERWPEARLEEEMGVWIS